MESSPDKAQHCTLPDPIDDIIPQFDGGADEKDDSSPRKGIEFSRILEFVYFCSLQTNKNNIDS